MLSSKSWLLVRICWYCGSEDSALVRTVADAKFMRENKALLLIGSSVIPPCLTVAAFWIMVIIVRINHHEVDIIRVSPEKAKQFRVQYCLYLPET